MNTDYLKFQASSIQALLRRKLTESGVLTDQLYPGSDTKIVIDLFAWTFDVLTYILNNNVSDVLFSDTRLYQNMNRLVKLLSYKPDGYHTSQAQFEIKINEGQNVYSLMQKTNIYIPRYAYIESSKMDGSGRPVCYSFLTPYVLSIYSYSDAAKNTFNVKVNIPDQWPVLYNGKYKKYGEQLIAHGVQYDTFLLTMIDLTTSNKIFVDHSLFNVFIQYVDSQTGQKVYEQWKQTQNLILNADADSKMFQIRLNQSKIYQLHFGDGVHGMIPEYGANIHVLYFQSNGQFGVIDTETLNASQLHVNIDGFGSMTEMFNMLYNGESVFKKNYGDLFLTNNIFAQACTKLQFVNINKSSLPSTFQDVQTMKQNAPLAFRRGHRLITEDDYESYIKSKYKSIIHDVFAANNNYYISTFYYWLKKYDRLNMNIRQDNYRFADSCDFNNIYLWFVSTNNTTINYLNFKRIVDDCNRIKCATSQLVPLNAVTTKFIPFYDFQDQASEYAYANSGMSLLDYANYIKIYVYKKPSAIIGDESLRQLINNIIISYFSIQNQRLGSTIQLNRILSDLYNLGYIKSIRTVNQIVKNNLQYVNGLSFAAWTTDLIDNKDFTVFQGSLQLQHFQFPKLIYSSLISMIKIINPSNNVNVEEF